MYPYAIYIYIFYYTLKPFGVYCSERLHNVLSRFKVINAWVIQEYLLGDSSIAMYFNIHICTHSSTRFRGGGQSHVVL